MNNPRYVTYTALFGPYDKLREVKGKSERCDYICFTDQKKLKSTTWNIIYVEKNGQSCTDMNRFYKMNPHILFNEYQYSIYIDSNIQIKKSLDDFVDKCIDLNYLIAAPYHPINDCIYDEIDYCFNLKKITEHERDVLIGKYEKEGFPHKKGLTENNVIFRKHNDKQIISLMNEWWSEFAKGPKRDQLSLWFVAWKQNVSINILDINSRFKNPFFSIHLHSNNVSFLKKIWFNISLKKDRSKILMVIFVSVKPLVKLSKLFC